jgi:hypothetical protein
MSSSVLYKKISSLPENLKKEVNDFIDLLIAKSKKKEINKNTPSAKFGCGKGMFTIHPGFDDPLEDFKEYMPE